MSPRRDVLLVTRDRAFWSTDVARSLFPNRVALPAYAGKATYLLRLPQVAWRFFMTHPRVLLLGTTTPYARLAARLRRMGFLKNVRLVTDHQFLTTEEAGTFDAVITYSREEIELRDPSIRDCFTFLRYPSKTALVSVQGEQRGSYIFAGGNHKRDFGTLLKAVEGLPVTLRIVTGQKVEGPLPQNVSVSGPLPMDEYFSVMAGARFVVIPLRASKIPHGHCDISAALSLGKPVISTRDASVSGYIEEGQNGLLVPAGDVAVYRDTVEKLSEDDALYQKLAIGARESAPMLSYEAFAEGLLSVIDARRTAR